jgi:hypothetical protein
VRRFNSSVKNSTNTMPIKKNQDVAERAEERPGHAPKGRQTKQGGRVLLEEREEAGNL